MCPKLAIRTMSKKPNSPTGKSNSPTAKPNRAPGLAMSLIAISLAVLAVFAGTGALTRASQGGMPSIGISPGIILPLPLQSIAITQPSKSPSEQAERVPAQKSVTCLGHLEPMGEIVKLTAPSSTQETVVGQLKCEEGDNIKEGQVLAVLGNENRLKAGVKQAEGSVAVARGKLAIVKAGAKRGQIDAQRSEVKRLESQLRARVDAQKALITKIENAFRQACIDYKRYEFLHKEKAVSNFDFDQKKLAMENSQQELIQAKAQLQEIISSQAAAIESARATLDSIAEVRTVDVEEANAELEQAEGNLAQARAALEQAYIRSPLTGKILKIYARPGERIAEEGFAELGRTQSMFVLAEVYQSDIAKVRLGQNVLIEADSLPGCKLSGTVKRIGQQVRKQNVINSDPTANIDERVVEVRVQLGPDASRKVQHLSNCQVTASIQI